MLADIGVVALLILLNGFFALSEMALVSASKPLLKQAAKNGSRRAALALRLTDNTGRFLSTIQTGITLVGIAAGAYGAATLAAKFGDFLSKKSWFQASILAPYHEEISYTIIIALITYFSIIIGELFPKQIALKHPEKISLFVAPAMTAIAFIFTPFVKILDLSGRSIFRLFGQKSYTQDQLTEEEMHAILAEGKETGVLHESEHEMFRRIMRLSDRDVRSFMTPRIDISSLPHDESLIALRALALEGGHSRYPVIDGDLDHIIGILDTRDLLALNNVDDPFIWRKSLHTPLVIPENASGLQTLEIFKNSSLPIAVIVDEYGTTQGLVTAADLLEAIIGVLPSNYDDEDPLIFARDSSSWLIDGAAPVDEALEAIGIDQPQNNGEYQTFAGFVLHHLAKEPLLGTTCHFENFVFEIIDMDGRRIDKILVTLKAAKDNDSRI